MLQNSSGYCPAATHHPGLYVQMGVSVSSSLGSFPTHPTTIPGLTQAPAALHGVSTVLHPSPLQAGYLKFSLQLLKGMK